MAKMRVHELAKELNIKSQDIIEFLNTTPYAVKSASSGLEDEAQDAVRKNYGKKNTAVDNQGAAKTDAAQQERPKKKSSINAIYNPQYSKQSSQRSGQQSAGKKENAGKSDRPKKETVAAKPETHTIIRPRPVGERAMRPISERTANNKDELLEGLKAQEERNNNERNNGERRERNNNGERNNGERKERFNNGDRNNGERKERFNNGDRNNGERRERFNNGDRNNNGERKERFNNGDRNNNGERRERFNNGDRNNNGERNNGRGGDRNNNFRGNDNRNGGNNRGGANGRGNDNRNGGSK